MEKEAEMDLFRRFLKKVIAAIIAASVGIVFSVGGIALVFWKNTEVRISALEQHNKDELISSEKTDKETETFRTDMKTSINTIEADIKELLKRRP